MISGGQVIQVNMKPLIVNGFTPVAPTLIGTLPTSQTIIINSGSVMLPTPTNTELVAQLQVAVAVGDQQRQQTLLSILGERLRHVAVVDQSMSTVNVQRFAPTPDLLALIDSVLIIENRDRVLFSAAQMIMSSGDRGVSGATTNGITLKQGDKAEIDFSGDPQILSQATIKTEIFENVLEVRIEFLQDLDEPLRTELAQQDGLNFDYDRSHHLEPHIKIIGRPEEEKWLEIQIDDPGILVVHYEFSLRADEVNVIHITNAAGQTRVVTILPF